MATLVVDMGLLYAEREELQNGADAAALAAAEHCAEETCTVASINDLAPPIASDNAADGLSDAAVICGPMVSSCPNEPQKATKCAKLRPASGNFVELKATTRTSAGTMMPPVFGRALLGDSYTGTTVRACARAAWGPLKEASEVWDFAISSCAFAEMTKRPEDFTPADQMKLASPDPRYEKIFQPGMFGTCGQPRIGLLNSQGGCFRKARAGEVITAPADIKVDWTDQSCEVAGTPMPVDAIFADLHKPLYIAIFKDTSIQGFAYFRPSGYQFTTRSRESNGRKCEVAGRTITEQDPCFMGFFGKATVFGTADPAPAAPDFGLTAIQLIG